MLEYIVRPFQAPNAHGTIVIPSTPKESTETAILTWGGESTLPAVQYTEVGFQFASCKEDNVEIKRDAEPVRITGNDPQNYIDVLRSNKLYLDKTSTKSSQTSAVGQTDYRSGASAAAFATDDSGFGSFSPSALFSPTAGYKESCAVTMSLHNNTSRAA